MTLDNWTKYLYNLMHTGEQMIPSIYFCSIIVMGNFFLLNLILAVLIKAFGDTQLKKEVS
jgi:hypothetical protein